MNDKVMTMARELAAELERTECCEKFRRYKKLVSDDQALFKRLMEFKKADFQYRVTHDGEAPSNGAAFEEEKAVSRLYAGLSLNEYARNYLESERAVLELFNEVISTISAACEIDMDC
jgi:cell fate (sporulation/competence/biofilm development) regulator YlbF (YheA/YmcA/DUF963 family)